MSHQPLTPAPTSAAPAPAPEQRSVLCDRPFDEKPAEAVVETTLVNPSSGSGGPSDPPPPPTPPFAGHNFGQISLYPRSIQPQLTVGAPDDPYEQEADRVADQVMAMAAPPPQQSTVHESSGHAPGISLQANSPGEDFGDYPLWQPPEISPYSPPGLLHRQGEAAAHPGAEAAPAGADLESKLSRSRGSGSPLPQDFRQFIEPRMGFDFSQVRIHTDSEAVQMNQQLSARAFAHGSDLYFGAGQFDASSDGGKRLLAHELTHVVQQTGGIQQVSRSPLGPRIQRSDPEAGAAPAAAVPEATPEPDWDALINEELTNFLSQFNNIRVTVSWVDITETQCRERSEEVAVSPPYFINRDNSRRRTAVANRDSARGEMRSLLRDIRQSRSRGGMGLGRAMVGKSSPEDIQQILQTALDRNQVPAGQGRDRPDSEDLRNWLIRYGIGIDCSGFVTQALNRVMQRIRMGPIARSDYLDPMNVGADQMQGGLGRFARVNRPDELRPGDTMHIRGHIRIVTQVNPTDGGIEFTTAESSSVGDIGPTQARWRYADPGRFRNLQRRAGDTWQNAGAGVTYGRYRPLARATAPPATTAPAVQPKLIQRQGQPGATLKALPEIPSQEPMAVQRLSGVRDRMQTIRRQVQTSQATGVQPDQAPLRNYWAGYNLAINRLTVQRQDAPAAAPAGAGTASATRTALPTLDAAARDLTTWLAMPNPMAHKEQIFRTLLLVRDQRSALRDAFQSVAGRSLNTALEAGLSGHDLIRAQRYLQYGTLRLADKLYFAAEGAGTDEDTFYRLLRQAHAQRSQVEADFQADYGATYSRDGTLPNGQASRIAGLLDDEFSDWELDKAKALFTYGELRPVDNIRIATNRIGTDETMLFAALEACNRQTVRADYQAAYHEDLDALLDSELSGDDKTRADLILQGRLNAFERIRLAVEGWGTDEQAIYDAISQASDSEREQLRNQFNNRASALYQMLDDDLSSSEMNRVRALLERGSTAQALLQQAGATGFSDIVDAIKMSRGQAFQTYKEAYNSDRDFQSYLRQNTRVVQYVEIGTLLNGTVEARLRWAIEGIGTDEDYIFHVLEHFTDDAAKQRLRSNTALMAELQDDLSSTEFGRVQDLLRPSNLGLEAGVEEVGDRIERDRSWITDLFSNAADALSDEHRELQAALDRARADGEISPAERAEIEQFQTQTEASLEVYRTVRDDLANTAATILTTAAALTIAVLTGGLASGASAAMIAAQLAQAALVSALARVAALKVVQGDRFDVFGADGAIAFGTGAIDGVMNVLGASAAQAVVGPMLRTAGRTAAQEAAEAGFNSLGRRLLTEAVEGGLSGATSSVFETAANETTWKRGFEAGITAVAINTGTAAVTGAGMSTGISGLGHARSRWGRGADTSTGGGGLRDTGTPAPHTSDAGSPSTPTGTSRPVDGGHAHGSVDFPGAAHAEGTPQPRSPVEAPGSSPRSLDADDTIPNIPRPHLEGLDEWPEGLVHYGLDTGGARQSYRASLEADPGREAGIWMDPTTGEHVVVQGGDTFVTGGWQREADFSGRPWVLVEHFHPGDDLGARFASEADFAAMMHPQLTGRVPPGPVSTEIRWRDPASRLEFITEIGYNPDLPSPFWIRYRDANGDWQVHLFDDVPWNAGSDYKQFLQGHGIPTSSGHGADTSSPQRAGVDSDDYDSGDLYDVFENPKIESDSETSYTDEASEFADGFSEYELYSTPTGEIVEASGQARKGAGNEFNEMGTAKYPNAFHEVRLDAPSGRHPRVDTYIPGKEIIERKYTQLAEIDEFDGLSYLQQLRVKYPPGSRIANVPTTRAMGIAGEVLQGTMVLEIPVQRYPIPPRLLDYARQSGIIIRDFAGTVYT